MVKSRINRKSILVNPNHFLSMLTLYIKLYKCIYVMYICICRFYVWYKITDERRNFFWWGQPSPIDIVNCNSVGKGSKKRSGIL